MGETPFHPYYHVDFIHRCKSAPSFHSPSYNQYCKVSGSSLKQTGYCGAAWEPCSKVAPFRESAARSEFYSRHVQSRNPVNMGEEQFASIVGSHGFQSSGLVLRELYSQRKANICRENDLAVYISSNWDRNASLRMWSRESTETRGETMMSKQVSQGPRSPFSITRDPYTLILK